jgi:hypothetical protein
MNAELSVLMERIESPEFVSRVGVVSSLSAFEAAIGRESLCREMLSALNRTGAVKDVRERLNALVAQQPPEGFAYKSDVSAAVYLRVLDILDPLAALDAARSIVEKPGLWWARFLGRRILGENDSALAAERFAVPSPRDISASTVSVGQTLSAEIAVPLCDQNTVIEGHGSSVTEEPIRQDFDMNPRIDVRLYGIAA